MTQTSIRIDPPVDTPKLSPAAEPTLSLRRVGIVMAPREDDPLEAGGVLNPAATRGPDGELYLFPRMVTHGNYSRIGIARVQFDDAGYPTGVDRLGVVLEPQADYEACGCEDPRISFVAPLGCYVMTYVAKNARGSCIALAASEDLRIWRKLGPVSFRMHDALRFAGDDDKDFCIFPEAVRGADGRPSLAILHRPKVDHESGCQEDTEPPGIWLSYCAIAPGARIEDLCTFTLHHRLAVPEQAWEKVKIGSGTPPVPTPYGWLLLYHGVATVDATSDRLCYSAGAMLLDRHDPRIIRFRTSAPLLMPELAEERVGVVPDAVFPTGIDRRDERGTCFDVYYGMADYRIGAARLELGSSLAG